MDTLHAFRKVRGKLLDKDILVGAIPAIRRFVSKDSSAPESKMQGCVRGAPLQQLRNWFVSSQRCFDQRSELEQRGIERASWQYS